MIRRTVMLSTCLLCVPMVGGCAESLVRPDVPMTSHSTDTTVPAGLSGMVAAARADAARRFGLPATAFEVASADPATWSDGSLGCPQPGMNYTQALVPGYRIRLRGPAGLLDYHAGTVGHPALCPADRAVDPAPDAGHT